MTIYSPVDTALCEAKEFARSICKKQQSEAAPVSSMHSYHDTGYFFWINHRCNCYPESINPKKNNKNGLIGGIIAATVLVAATASYFLGGEIGNLSNASASKRNLSDRKIAVIETAHPAKEKTLEVIHYQEKMLDAMETEAKRGIALKSSLIASALLAGGGTVLSILGTTGTMMASAGPLFAIPGVVAGVGTACTSLYRWGFLNSDTSHQESAVRLYQLADQAQRC